MISFDIVDDLLNFDTLGVDNPIYIDTDSLFLTLPVSLEHQREEAKKYVNALQDTINLESLKDFLHMHNIKIREKEESPLLICDFKNEYMIKAIILYSKKRYISVIIETDKDGNQYYDIDIKGVEGKRATNAFVKKIVDDLIEYLKKLENTNNIHDRFGILENVMLPYREAVLAMKNKSIYENIDYFSMPVNVNKQIEQLKNVAGYYKGTVIFDIVGEKSWAHFRGKGRWLKVSLKDESYIPTIMKEFAEFEQIKIANKKPHMLIRDITIPDDYLQKENAVVDSLFDAFEVDYEGYYEQLLKKIALLYRPFDEAFCDKLDKRITKTVSPKLMILGEHHIFEKDILPEKNKKSDDSSKTVST
jgi:hypothetical protein